jgi:acyl carrier protein
MSDDIRQQVRVIVAEQAMIDVGEVSPDSTMEDLGLDSLGLVEIVFAIEEEFGVSVPYNANEPNAEGFDISTVKAVEDGVIKLVAEKV